MNKKDLIAHIKSRQGIDKATIFTLPLGEIKILPGFNRRIDYNLEPLIQYIKDNGVKFPPLKLQIVDGELYIDQGHRRTMASIEAGMDLKTTRIECYVDNTENTERNLAERIADQISSNQGEKYSNIELMLVCRDLNEKYNWTSQEIYKRVGISQSKYSNLSKMFGLSNKLIVAINESKVNYSEIVDALRLNRTEEEIFELVRARIKYEVDLLAYKEGVESDKSADVESSTSIDTLSDVSDDEHIELVDEDDNIDLTPHYVDNVQKQNLSKPNTYPPKRDKPTKPNLGKSKVDYKDICDKLVNFYTIDQHEDFITITIPVMDWDRIAQDIEKGMKK